VLVEPAQEEGARVFRLAFLNARGQTVVHGLPTATYRLDVLAGQVSAPARVLDPVEMGAGVLGSAPPEEGRLAAAGPGGEPTREPRVWSGRSDDGSLLWTVEATEEGDVQVAIETVEKRLAGQTVEFKLVDPATDKVPHDGRLTLQPARTAEKWEAWASLGPARDLGGPYELVLHLVPPEGGSAEAPKDTGGQVTS
jgi:hypothetical protein